MSQQLDHRPIATAVVTGANSGIGKEIARQLSATGWTVYVGSRTVERGAQAVTEIGGGARVLVLDVTDPVSIAAAAAQVGALDVLVNNAGVMVDGRSALDPEVVTQLHRASRRTDGLGPLTPREDDVLNLMAEGRTFGAIAAALVISERAVEKHVANILSKLDLAPSETDHRRVLAVLRYLGS